MQTVDLVGMTALNLAEGSIKSSRRVFLGHNREFLVGISDEAMNLQIPEKCFLRSKKVNETKQKYYQCTRH